MRKAFTGIKLIAHCNVLKDQEKRMIYEYQFRKWFGKWRLNYLIKSQNNYLVPPQASAMKTVVEEPSYVFGGLGSP